MMKMKMKIAWIFRRQKNLMKDQIKNIKKELIILYKYKEMKQKKIIRNIDKEMKYLKVDKDYQKQKDQQNKKIKKKIYVFNSQ